MTTRNHSRVQTESHHKVLMAWELLRKGDTVKSLELLCSATVGLLNFHLQHGDQTVAQSPLLQQWPALGVELQHSDQGIVCIFRRRDFSALEIACYLRHYISCAAAELPMSRTAGFLQAGVECLQRWIQCWQQSLLRKGSRRSQLRLQRLQCWSLRLQYCDSAWRASRQLLHCQLAYYLREPSAAIAGILQQQLLRSSLMQLRRQQSIDSETGSQTCSGSMQWRQRSHYIRLQAGDRRSRLIATFHFGDFVSAMETFSAATVRQRRRAVVRYQEHEFNLRQRSYRDAAQRRRALPQMMNSQQLDPLAAVAFLRRGNANLTMFCDLPRNHGECIDVQFLGRPAWFNRGPAEIALLARVPILVVIGCERQGRLQLETPGVIEAVRTDQESMAQAARRITQALVDILEVYLRQYPAQWYYLPKLASYFVSDRGLDAWQL